MTYSIEFSNEAKKTIKKFKKSNPQLFQKLQDILLEISQHPRTGIGHPEPLKGGGNTLYSRHLSAHIRLIYEIHDEIITVMIISMDSHYNDK